MGNRPIGLIGPTHIVHLHVFPLILPKSYIGLLHKLCFIIMIIIVVVGAVVIVVAIVINIIALAALINLRWVLCCFGSSSNLPSSSSSIAFGYLDSRRHILGWISYTVEVNRASLKAECPDLGLISNRTKY